MYDNKDEEELLAVDFQKRQRMYAKEGMYDPKGNVNRPPIQQPQPPPPKPLSTTKKGNAKKRKSVQNQTRKKKTKKMKKTDKTALPTSKLYDANGDTVVTHETILPSAHICIKFNTRTIPNQRTHLLY